MVGIMEDNHGENLGPNTMYRGGTPEHERIIATGDGRFGDLTPWKDNTWVKEKLVKFGHIEERYAFKIFFRLERLHKPPNEDFKDWQLKTTRKWAMHEELPLVEYFPYVLLKYAPDPIVQGDAQGILQLRKLLQVRGISERFEVPDEDQYGNALANWQGEPPTFVISKKLYEVRDRLIIAQETIDKWLSEESDGPQLFRDVKARFRFFCDMEEHWATLLALWAMGTHIYQAFSAYPYIFLWAEAGSGKTRILKTTAPLVHMGKHVEDPSAASAFRMVDAVNATLCIDEADKLTPDQNAELLGILNTGYEFGATVSRYNVDKRILEEFNAYSPKMLASNRSLGNSLESRCLRIPVQRSSNSLFGEREPNDDLHRATSLDIQQDLTIWAIDKGPEIMALDRKVIMDKYRARFEGTPIRLVQIMLPLLVLYDVLGIDDEEGENLRKIIEYQCAEKRSESIQENALRVLMALAELVDTAGASRLTTKSIVMRIEPEKEEAQDFKPSKVGIILRKFNIPNRTVNGKKEYMPGMSAEERKAFMSELFTKYSIARSQDNGHDPQKDDSKREWERYT